MSYTKIEQEIIKLLIEKQNLTLRRAHVLVQSADSVIAVKKAVERLARNKVVYVSDENIVRLTSSFIRINRKDIKSNALMAHKKQTNKTSRLIHQPSKTERLIIEEMARQNIEPVKPKAEGFKVKSEPTKIKARRAPRKQPIDINRIRKNLDVLSKKAEFSEGRPTIEDPKSKVENIY